ncbi:hypothetical protein ACS386_07600 [Flavobacteriaceae bacterium LMO-SS05]
MKRKTFIQKTVGALLLAIPAYSIVSCSSSEDGPSGNPNPNPNPSGNCLQNGTNIAISGNHGHALTVSVADINAGVDKTYSIEGSADHDHAVTVTAAQFNTLKSNMQVGINSTIVQSHSHTLTISCAS